MRLPAALLLCAGLGLGPALVRAGAEVRGVEILLFYNAYRLDVEVSAALAKEKGENPENSWKLAKKVFNMPSDFADGKVDTSKLGANFHGFTGGTASMGYAKETGLGKIKDPWNPTWQEVKDIVKWAPITKGNQYSYGGFDVQTMLGDLAGGQPNSVPTEGGKRTKNHFFDFDNMLAIIGKRCSDLHTLKPDIAKPYMQRMAELSDLAYEGRAKESAEFKITDIKKALTEKYSAFDKKNPKTITGAVVTKKATTANFGDYQDLDVDKTTKGIEKVAGKNAGAIKEEFNKLAAAYTTASTAKTIEAVKAVDGLDSQTKDHLRVRVQEKALRRAIVRQIGGTPASACKFPNVNIP